MDVISYFNLIKHFPSKIPFSMNAIIDAVGISLSHGWQIYPPTGPIKFFMVFDRQKEIESKKQRLEQLKMQRLELDNSLKTSSLSYKSVQDLVDSLIGPVEREPEPSIKITSNEPKINLKVSSPVFMDITPQEMVTYAKEIQTDLEPVEPQIKVVYKVIETQTDEIEIINEKITEITVESDVESEPDMETDENNLSEIQE